jgi:hypothetical protein
MRTGRTRGGQSFGHGDASSNVNRDDEGRIIREPQVSASEAWLLRASPPPSLNDAHLLTGPPADNAADNQKL